MKLYLVQHGEAYSKEADPDRPLTEQGRLDIDRLGAILKQAGIQADRVIHSGKLRALQTAKRLSYMIAPEVKLEANKSINPNDDPKAFDLLTEGRDEDTLVVGHLPFMAKLVSHLVTGDEERPITDYQPGTVVCLDRMDDARWQINWMLRPDLFR